MPNPNPGKLTEKLRKQSSLPYFISNFRRIGQKVNSNPRLYRAF